ncbi:Ig-like domain-containing protein [Vibrio vulnificus]|nr:Ig-like domain-containing protein [Vibrio vulnificus]
MKTRHSITTILVALIALIGLSGCNHSVKELVVTPKQSTVPIGFQQQLKAEKVYKKGKVVDATHTGEVKWRSSDESIATVDSHGLVSTYDKPGVVEITAVGNFKNREFADTVTLEVTGAFLTSITVTPKDQSTPVGLTRSYTATVFFSNGQAIDITGDRSTQWSSSDTDVATISNANGHKGIAIGKSIGTSIIAASFEFNGHKLSDSSLLTVGEAIVTDFSVTPATQAVPVGLATQFSAIAQLSDGKAINVTDYNSINWSISNTNIAELSNDQNSKGLATGVDVGSTNVSASGLVNDQFVYGMAKMVVTEAIIESLEIIPTTETVPVGLKKSFKVIANLSNGQKMDVTNDKAISWTSSNSDIASVSNSSHDKGTATGVSIGNVTLTAFVEVNGREIKGSASLKVTKAIAMSLNVSPKPQLSLDTPQVPVGWNKQFKAEVTMSDGTIIDVSKASNLFWSSEDPNIATISNDLESKGLSTGVTTGKVFITAKLLTNDNSLENRVTLTITPPHTLSISVLTSEYANVINGSTVYYGGYFRGLMGKHTILGGDEYLDSPMHSAYIGGKQEDPANKVRNFIFGQANNTPISGALKYRATFDWPDGQSSEGVLEWQFDKKHYMLTEIKPINNLLYNLWDFTITVSNKEKF